MCVCVSVCVYVCVFPVWLLSFDVKKNMNSCTRMRMHTNTHTHLFWFQHSCSLLLSRWSPAFLPLVLWIWFNGVAAGDISAYFEGLTVAIYRSMSCKWGHCTNRTLVSSQALSCIRLHFSVIKLLLVQLSSEAFGRSGLRAGGLEIKLFFVHIVRNRINVSQYN